jgi:3-oxoacyl-[acyl-carrier protein] reductase
MVDLHLSNRTAVVFGGSRGLGKAIAAELAAEGVKVVIVARDPDRTQKTALELGVLGLEGDVSLPAVVAISYASPLTCSAEAQIS